MAAATSPRVTTFSGHQLYEVYDPSAILAQKVQRLRVNRIAIVQTLKVDHVLPRLLQRRVLEDTERKLIMSGRTSQDKTRLLLDILPQKGKSVDWFSEFRDALKNPDTSNPDIKKKYQMILDFLDNTLIQVPPRKTPPPKAPISPIDAAMNDQSFPRYHKLPSISTKSPSKAAVSEFTYEQQSTAVTQQDGDDDYEGFGVKQYTVKELPDLESYQPLITEPTEIFDALRQSGNADDREQVKDEKAVLAQMQEVETIFALENRAQVPEDFVLCFSEPVQTMLSSPHTHLYFKYLHYLTTTYSLDVLSEVAYSLISFLDTQEDCSAESLRFLVVQTGFKLFEFLCDYSLYDKAETVILTVMRYLSSRLTLENYMCIWQGLVKMMNIANTNIKFEDAHNTYLLAMHIGQKIKLMSFGQDILDESPLFMELSILLREQGSLNSSYSWAQRAMKEVDEGNNQGVVNVLCNAVLVYSMQWKVKQAEQIAILAVRFAKQYFGVRHPMYVKALLHYVSYSNEFRQDAMGVQVAQTALNIALQIYGGAPSIVVAQAHEALAKALVAANKFDSDDYVANAMSAWRMAIDVIPGAHPRLAPYRHTHAQVLQWKAVQVETTKTDGFLVWAETEAMAALYMFKSCWGEYSLKFVQSLSLMGQIYAKQNQSDKAEEYLKEAIDVLRLCAPATSNYHALAKASLGLFYRTADKPLEAIQLLKDSLDSVVFGGIYLRWIQMCYDSVITLCKAVGQTKDAEHYQIALVDYLKKNPHFSEQVTWEQLHEASPSLEDMKESVFQLQTKMSKIKDSILAAAEAAEAQQSDEHREYED